jgi:phage gp36-like protein
MTYATQQDLIDRFGLDEILQLSDRDNLGAIDTTVVARVLADTDSRINAYLEPVYTLPLTTVNPVLVGLAADIARYMLYDVTPNDQVRLRYEDALKFLDGVSTGKRSLGIDAGNLPTPVSGGPKITASNRVFTSDGLSDY